MIKCNECKYFNNIGEYRIPLKFVEVRKKDPTKPDDFPEGPLGELSCESGRPMCCHPKCFSYKEFRSPECGLYKNRIRVAGQAQFNGNNDCSLFSERKSLWTHIKGLLSRPKTI